MEEEIIVEIVPEPEYPRIGEEDRFLLESSARWGKFVSIFMFVCLGLGLAAIIFWMIATAVAGFSMYDMGIYGAASPMYGAIMWALMIFCFLIYMVQMLPAIYLYRFSKRIREGLSSGSESVLTESFRNLRGSIKTTGIILIVSVSFSVLFAIVMVGWFAMAL